MEDVRQKFPGAIIVFFILLFVFAKWGPSIPFSVLSQSKGEPMIVTASANVPVTPDVAKINVGVEETGATIKQVQDSVNTRSQKIVTDLKKLGIAEKDIKTTAYNISPESDFSVSPVKITGYRVNVSYEVTIRDFGKINDALITVTGSGANIVGGINFDLSDSLKNEKMGEARKQASDIAKEKAKSLASAAGITLGKIINVSESQGVDFPRPMLAKSAVGLGGSPVAQPDIQPGQTDVSVTISLSYEVR